jgi:CrcB protein
MTMWSTLLWVAAGGALGAVARSLVTGVLFTWVPGAFPWGTLVVNVVGSFLIGVLFASLSGALWLHTIARPFLVVGFLGAFTTFSAFSIETLTLIDDGRAGVALLYALLSVCLCVGAAWAGVRLAG